MTDSVTDSPTTAETLPVRTRFAPSPTGFMHIGGMRTALFSWLWARHTGGQFLLRIDDTDRERHVESALEPILDSFRWLGLDWDEGPEVGGPYGPYFQSERGNLYEAAVTQLLAEKKAFRDFDPPAVSQADREEAEREKRNYLNVRRSLDLSEKEIAERTERGDAHVIRFLMPRGQNRQIEVHDLVRGRSSFPISDMPDPVIYRSNGTPLYNFASVVDDALMGITHVIRAEEHFSNVPVQASLFEALGKQAPVFAHVPFITAPGTSKKLSKRDAEKLQRNPAMRHLFNDGTAILSKLGLELDDGLNPMTVAFYQTLGYLPAGMINSLSRLGWAYDDKTEIMSRDFVIENFDLEKVVKSPAGFDPEKLMNYQSHWMTELPREEKIAGCADFLARAGLISAADEPAARERVGEVVDVLEERIRIFGDILAFDEYFVADEELEFDSKAFDKRIRNAEGATDRLRAFRAELESAEPFTPEVLETRMGEFCEREEIKLGEIIHAVRVATTGKPKGPGMFDALALTGRESCLRRIDRALELAATDS